MGAILLAVWAATAVGAWFEYDAWWHLKTGQLVLESGIPQFDPFSWTFAGRPWYDFEWLFQAGIYLLSECVGLALVQTVALLLALSGSGWLVARLASTGHGVRSATAILPTLCLLATVLHARGALRPHLAMWLMAPGGLLLLSRALREPVADRRRWLLGGFLLLLVVWVNLHSSWVIGLALGFAFVAAGLLGRAGGAPASERLLFSGLLLAAPLLNPYGRHILDPLLAHTAPESLAYINEWKPLTLADATLLSTDGRIGWLALGLLGGAALLRAGRRQDPLLPVMFLLSFGLSLLHLRFIDLFALTAAVPACESTKRIWETGRPWPRAGLAALALLPAGIVLGQADWGRPGAIDLARHPVTEAEFIAAIRPPGPLFNTYNDGGHLIWRLHPGQPVYIDGRTPTLYDERFFWEYRRMENDRRLLLRELGKRGVNTALMPRGDPFCFALRNDPAWSAVFIGPARVVFVRRDGADGGMITRFHTEGFDPCGSALEFVRLVEGKLDEPTRAMLDRLYAASGEMLAVVPENPELLLMRALIETFARGRPEAALASLDLVPDRYRLGLYDIARGVALKTAGRPDEAAAAFRRSSDAGNPYGLYHLGRLRFEQRRYDEAYGTLSDCFREMRDGLPGDGFYLLGHAAYETGRFAPAAEYYRRAVMLEPENAVYRFNLGNALLATGDRSGALAAYFRAFSLDPANRDAGYNAAMVLASLGQPARAAGLLEGVAARMGPEADDERNQFLGKARHLRANLQ